MAQVIQLQFDFAHHPAPHQDDGEQKTDVPKGRKVIWEDKTFHRRLLEPTKRACKNPCAKCYLREVCGSDDCGRKLFPIDVNEIY
jgi:MoaA/NifB/PqqE/SkfB family radical SAM enzyme